MAFWKSYHTKTDEVLMDLICKGDQDALTQLYNRYYPRIVRYFYRMLADEDLARDLVQDLFIKIMEHPEGFDTTRKFSPWFYRTAGNMARNSWRLKSRRESRERFWMESRDMENTRNQEEVFNAALMELDSADRELFTLRYELQISLAEIGEVLQIPEGTVKSRCFTLKQEIIANARKVMSEFNIYE